METLNCGLAYYSIQHCLESRHGLQATGMKTIVLHVVAKYSASIVIYTTNIMYRDIATWTCMAYTVHSTSYIHLSTHNCMPQ